MGIKEKTPKSEKPSWEQHKDTASRLGRKEPEKQPKGS